MSEVTTATIRPEIRIAVCRADCGTTFVQAEGFVPDLITLYEQVRGTVVVRQQPLTRLEILTMEFCRSCSRNRLFEKFEIRMFPTTHTLQCMQEWVQKNAADMDRRRHEKAEREEREQAAVIAQAQYRPDNRGLVNKIFSETKPRVEKARPKHRTHTHSHKPPRNPDAPKNYGIGRVTPIVPQSSKKKGKKNKGGDQKQGPKGKGR